MELNNDHNVYILGAGFSKEAGLPVIDDFLLKMRDSHEWLKTEGREREAAAVERVLEFRLNASSAAYWVKMELENIEELFSLASAGIGNINDDVRLAIAATLEFSRVKSFKRTQLYVSNSRLFQGAGREGKPTSHPDWADADDEPVKTRGRRDGEVGPFKINTYEFHAARLLGMFESGQPKGKNTFISFNYDTLLEDGLRALGLQFCYGFKPRTVNFDEEAWGQLDESSIHLLKLHGSVNWARRRSGGRGLTVFGDYTRVLNEGLIPELVPPTWKKVFESQLQAVWSNAVKRLRTATRIVIIGFSMPPTDMHFKYLMAAGLEKNVSLRKILFVGPSSRNDLEARARKLLREAYVDSKQIDFVDVPLGVFTSDRDRHMESIGRPGEHGVSYELFTVTG